MAPQVSQLAAINKGLQDVLLHVEIVIVDGRQGLAEDRKVFHRFVDAVIVDVVAGRFCAQDEVIADILLDKAVCIMAADHRIGQVHVLDLGLQLAPIVLGDLAAEDDGDLVRLSDGAIGVKQAFAEHVQCGAAMEDEVVAIFDLGEEQAVLAAGLISLFPDKEGGQASQPFLAASHQVLSSARVGEFLKTLGCGAFVAYCLTLTHSVGEPVMLVDADPG